MAIHPNPKDKAMAFPYRAMRPIRHGQMPATTFDVIRGEQVVGRVYESPSGWCSAQYRTVSGKFQPVGQGRCHTNKLAAAKEVTACHLVGLFHWEEQSDAIGTAAKLDRIRAELADVLKVQGYDNGTRAAAQAILA
jgi:hypothetical protein